MKSAVQSNLVSIQVEFKANLLESLETYKTSLSGFSDNYQQVSTNSFYIVL